MTTKHFRFSLSPRHLHGMQATVSALLMTTHCRMSGNLLLGVAPRPKSSVASICVPSADTVPCSLNNDPGRAAVYIMRHCCPN